MMRRPSLETLLTCTFVLIGVVWGGFLGARQIAGIGSGLDRVEYLTLDWRFLLAGARSAPRGVVIAAVDDETLREVGTYPVPRDVLARIIRDLAAQGPQAIAVDMLFVDAGKPDLDAALADALRAKSSVVGAVGVFKGEGRDTGGRSEGNLGLIPAPSSVLWPIAAVRDAARSGLVNMSTDHAGVPRFIPMLFRVDNTIAPSFVLAASSAALNTEPVFGTDTVKLAARTVQLDLGYHLPIRYYGPRGSIRQFSVARVLKGDLDPDLIRGQVVLIGATGLAMGDTFPTSFDRVMPGVEVLATAVSNLLAADGLVRTNFTRKIDAAVAILFPGLMVVLLGLRRAVLGIGLAALILIGWIATAYAAFLASYWLAVAVPLAAILPVTVIYGLARVVMDRTAAQRLSRQAQALAKFQSPFLVHHILANPQFLVDPVQQDIPVVFLDLSGFTGVAEVLGPQWVRDLLADFQSRVYRSVTANDGYVSGFMGDGAMIIFGLPHPRADDASRALRTIVQLRESMVAWLGTLPPVVKDRLSFRIGGHFGRVMLSRLGTAEHQHVTATGDTVNGTSRLLEIAKQRSAMVVVTEDLWNAVASSDRDAIVTTPPVELEVRGRSQGLRVRILD